jgi:hypothetical protein
MLIKNGIKFYEYEDAIKDEMPEGCYYLYRQENGKEIKYEEIVEYDKRADNIPMFSYLGWDIPYEWSSIGITESRITNLGIGENKIFDDGVRTEKITYKEFLVGPILPPVEIIY